MRFRRTPSLRLRPKRRVDMQEYNLCRFILGTGNNPCTPGEGSDGPSVTWNLLVAPKSELSGVPAPETQRGISFAGCRFRYKYHTIDVDPTIRIGVVRYWSAIIAAPCNGATGAPLGDGSGALPILGNIQGDIGFGGIRILWRGLDFAAMSVSAQTVNLANDWGRYVPLERVKAKAFLKEGTGLYFVSEVVSPSTQILTHTLDLTMSLVLRSVR